jgi:hypothetical protein
MHALLFCFIVRRSVLLLNGIEGIGIDFGQLILDTDANVQESMVSTIGIKNRLIPKQNIIYPKGLVPL